MKRTGPIARRTELRRREPVRKRNPRKDYDAEHERKYGPHRGFVVAQPSCVPPMRDDWSGIEPHHCKGGGTGRKSDARWLVPLTARQHTEYHTMGPSQFFKLYGVEVDFEAVATALWQRSPYREEASK